MLPKSELDIGREQACRPELQQKTCNMHQPSMRLNRQDCIRITYGIPISSTLARCDKNKIQKCGRDISNFRRKLLPLN